MIIYLRVVPGLWVAVEELRRPELRSRPIIMGGLPHQRGLVHEANILAQQAGVRAGMTLSQAHQQCPDGIFLVPDLSRYEATWQKICDVLRTYTPLVEPLEMGEVVCDVSGCERRWNGDWDMARHITWEVWGTTGIASWLGAASNRLVAQLASMSVGADGITIVPKGQEGRFLADLPITLLPEVDPRLALTFQVLGLRTIGQFAALPASSVKQRFGVTGEKLHRFSRGIDSRRVIPPPAKPSVTARYECEEGSLEEAIAAIHRLAEKCATELQERRLAGKLVELKLEFFAGDFLRGKRRAGDFCQPALRNESQVASHKSRVTVEEVKPANEGLPVPYRIHSMLPQPSPESRVMIREKRSAAMEGRVTEKRSAAMEGRATEKRSAAMEGRATGSHQAEPQIFRPPARSKEGAATDCHATWNRAAMKDLATLVIQSSATVRTAIDTASPLIERTQQLLLQGYRDTGHKAWSMGHEGYGEDEGNRVGADHSLHPQRLQALELTVSEFEAPSQLSFDEFNRIDQTGGLGGLDAGRLKALAQQEEVLIARHGETPFRHVVEVDPVNVLAERQFRWEEGLLKRRS